MVKWLACFCDQEDGLADKQSLEYFMVSLQSDELCVVEFHENWAHYCDFEMLMCTNRGVSKMFVKWHNLEVFALPPFDRPEVYVQLPDLLLSWEPSCFLLVPSPSVFYY